MFQGINSNKCHSKNWKVLKYGLPHCYVQILYFIQFFILSGFLEVLWEAKFRWIRKIALRIRYLAIEMYKCIHGPNPPYLNELFVSKNTRYNLHDSNRLQQPEFQTVRYDFKSFRYYGSKLWSSLPADVEHSENLYHFKKIITQWCVSGKCDGFIIQWQTWYFAPYMKSIALLFFGY